MANTTCGWGFSVPTRFGFSSIFGVRSAYFFRVVRNRGYPRATRTRFGFRAIFTTVCAFGWRKTRTCTNRATGRLSSGFGNGATLNFGRRFCSARSRCA